MYNRSPNLQPDGARCASGLATLLAPLVLALGWAAPSHGEDYVLLRNGNVIQGTAVTVGPVVVIRHGGGNELKLNASQVAFSASTLRELYDFRVASRQIRDVSSCHDDARWCFRNGLYREMAEALDAAQELDLTHPETLRLRRQLQVALASSSRQPAAPLQAEPLAPTETPAAAPSGSRAQPLQSDDAELESLQVTSESLVFFTSRVQPILLNRCGNSGCHRSPTEADWTLTHMGVQVRPPARMTRLNLVATLQLINLAEPSESDLLRYAVHPHAGRREPPLRRIDDMALDSLQEWAQLVAGAAAGEDAAPLTPFAEVPLQATAVLPAAPLAAPLHDAAPSPIQRVGYLQERAAHQRIPAESGPTAPPSRLRVPSPAPQPVAPQAARPTRLPPIDDPFNPEIFNRHYRGEAVIRSGSR